MKQKIPRFALDAVLLCCIFWTIGCATHPSTQPGPPLPRLSEIGPEVWAPWGQRPPDGRTKRPLYISPPRTAVTDLDGVSPPRSGVTEPEWITRESDGKISGRLYTLSPPPATTDAHSFLSASPDRRETIDIYRGPKHFWIVGSNEGEIGKIYSVGASDCQEIREPLLRATALLPPDNSWDAESVEYWEASRPEHRATLGQTAVALANLSKNPACDIVIHRLSSDEIALRSKDLTSLAEEAYSFALSTGRSVFLWKDLAEGEVAFVAPLIATDDGAVTPARVRLKASLFRFPKSIDGNRMSIRNFGWFVDAALRGSRLGSQWDEWLLLHQRTLWNLALPAFKAAGLSFEDDREVLEIVRASNLVFRAEREGAWLQIEPYYVLTGSFYVVAQPDRKLVHFESNTADHNLVQDQELDLRY